MTARPSVATATYARPVVATTTYDSPVGPLGLMATEIGLLRVDFESTPTRAASGRGAAQADARLAGAVAELDEYFAGERQVFTVPLDWSESQGFRLAVLKELFTLPCGEVISYGELAARVGRPGAARAVGSAMATNPLAVVVPCHRVVRSGGALGEFGGGVATKRRLLELEGAW